MATTTTKKSTTATTTTAKKENAMTLTMPEKNNLANRIAMHNEAYAVIVAADVTPTAPVVNCCPDKDETNLTNDPVELEFLRYVCAYFGWSNELCTKSQGEDNGGTLKEDFVGWPATWMPRTTKTGKNAGKTTTWCQFVFPKEAFDWKDGSPAFDEEKKLRENVEKAQKALARAEKELDKFLHPEKYGRKTKAALQSENDKLRAALEALKAQGIEVNIA